MSPSPLIAGWALMAVLWSVVASGQAGVSCDLERLRKFSLPLMDFEAIDRRIVAARAGVKSPRPEEARQELALITIELVLEYERQKALGREAAAAPIRQRISADLTDTLWRVGHLARKGNAGAGTAAGTIHAQGWISAPDQTKACDFYRQAAAGGQVYGIYHHALCLSGSDHNASLTVMQEAEEAGHAGASEALGLLCLQSEPREDACALNYFCRAAVQGRARSASLAGWIYSDSDQFRDDKSAYLLYVFAASAGEPSAQNNLGEMYEKGQLGQVDHERAASWYLKAAQQGFGSAELNYARLLISDKRDDNWRAEARRWLISAQRHGAERAVEMLDWLDSGVRRDQ